MSANEMNRKSKVPDCGPGRGANSSAGIATAGRAWKLGDNLDTDMLAPGRYMKFSIDEIAKHCLEDVLPQFASTVQPGDVVTGGRNFGVGSSREQAPQALKVLGVAAIVAVSYAGLFYRNALNLGLPVVVCKDALSIEDGELVRVNPEAGTIDVTHPASGVTRQLTCEPIPAFLMAMVNAGGLVPHLEQRLKGKAA